MKAAATASGHHDFFRIAFAGTPQFAVPALRSLLGSRHRVVGVLTQPDRPAGRGRELRASPVKLLASQHGVAIAQPATLKTAEGRAAVHGWSPDLIVVVAYGLILPLAVLTLPRMGCLNIHGSLLPRWRGAAPIHRAVLAGDTETGVSIMQLEEGLDTGPVLLERRHPIGIHDTTGDLHDALSELGAAALLEAIDGFASGALVPRAQPADGVTYASKIDKSKRRSTGISRSRTGSQDPRFHPWPIAETGFAGETLRVLRARVAEPQGNPPLRNLVGLADDGLHVACGRGCWPCANCSAPASGRIGA